MFKKLIFLGLLFINSVSNCAEAGEMRKMPKDITLYPINFDCQLKINSFKKSAMMPTNAKTIDDFIEAVDLTINLLLREMKKIPVATKYHRDVTCRKKDGSDAFDLNEINSIDVIITDPE